MLVPVSVQFQTWRHEHAGDLTLFMDQVRGLREECAALKAEVSRLEALLQETSGSASSLAIAEADLRRQIASLQARPSSCPSLPE